ncbi:MAG: 2-amino-4-hydroxy-6-hydroxymethyldihydropteridine diphosphokinase [Gemmatimonadota bacterium]
MTKVAFALGSNVGDRRALLARAARWLSDHLRGAQVSSLYETEPVGDVDQGAFLNAVVVGETDAPPPELARWIRHLECEAGRVRRVRWGPRTLDVDLILLGARVEESAGLRIPHPRWKQRSFVLAPLAEVAPAWTDPESGLPVSRLYEALDPALRTPCNRIADPEWSEAVRC